MKLLGMGLDCFGGYFVHEWILAEGIADQQILSSFVVEVVGCNVLPQTFRDFSLEHRLHQLGYFVLSAWGTSYDIVGYICISAGPIYHCSGE